MSSSNYIRRPELIDLGQTEPPSRQEEFRSEIDFETLDSSVVRELTPDEAYRNGLAEGEQLGREATLKELSPVLEEFQQIAKSMACVREQRFRDAESELVQIAGELTRRILRAELSQDSDAVARMAQACINEAAEEGPLTLRVCASDVDRIRTYFSELELDLADDDVQLVADDRLEPGSVVLETPLRAYDGRAERILAAAQQRAETDGGGK